VRLAPVFDSMPGAPARAPTGVPSSLAAARPAAQPEPHVQRLQQQHAACAGWASAASSPLASGRGGAVAGDLADGRDGPASGATGLLRSRVNQLEAQVGWRSTWGGSELDTTARSRLWPNLSGSRPRVITHA
jgi:hypothetical protein